MSDTAVNGGEALVEALLSRGVDTVFFVPGGTYVTVLEALSRHTNTIRCVPMRLESSAMFAAEAYAAIRRKPAVVMVSRAPGACNAAIGVHTAMQGSRPVILMVAGIPKKMRQREAFQEIEYHNMFPAVAKDYFDVHSFDEVAPVVSRALDLSVSGRPGPVVLSLAKDVLDGVTGAPVVPPLPSLGESAPGPNAARDIAQLMDAASRPIILAGEMVGFENATEALVAYADATGAGVMAAYRQQDLFPNEHPAWLGQLTLNRTPHMEQALAECDLLVAIGSRLDSVTTADYTMVKEHHKLVMIYPEPSEFSQWQPTIGVSASAKASLEVLTAAVGAPPTADRMSWRDQSHGAEFEFATPGEIKVQGQVDMAQVIGTVSALVPKDSIQVSDAGTFGRWIQRYYRCSQPASSIGPISGAMGFGLPGGIGAAVADDSRPVFVWVGDGGFLMTGNEAATMVQEKLPVKIIVCDNNAWGSIMTHQRKRFPGWEFGVRLESPDFATLAEGFGMAAFPVRDTAEFEPALKAAMAVDGPALLHLHLDSRDVSPFAAD